MYTQKKEIIIRKFNLKEKCKFGTKCKFFHIQKFNSLKVENVSLRSELKQKSQELQNLKLGQTALADADAYWVHALQEIEKKVTYSSFFKKQPVISASDTLNPALAIERVGNSSAIRRTAPQVDKLKSSQPLKETDIVKVISIAIAQINTKMETKLSNYADEVSDIKKRWLQSRQLKRALTQDWTKWSMNWTILKLLRQKIEV